MARPRQREIPVEALVGGKIAPQRAALSGMRGLERQLGAEFKQRVAARDRLARAYKPLQDDLGGALGGGAVETARRLKALNAELLKRRLAAPPTLRDEGRIFAGSIGATVVPPFNYQWTWQAQNGNARNFPAATAKDGKVTVACDTSMNNPSSASCRAAVGIYFRPVVTNGILRISATPGFTFNWWTICSFASAHSDAFIGLYVGRYTLAGGFDGAPVSQMVSLWSDDSWWSGSWNNPGSNSGFPLSAQINVDSAHWYAIWVWMGANVSAAGWGGWGSGSGASSSLIASVPSFTWELF
jgi:hypothetical protein